MNPRSDAIDEGYSPPISIELVLHGHRFNVASVGPNMAILRNARKLEPGNGIIQWNVGGQITVYHAILPQGIDPQRNEQPFVLIDATSEAAA